MFLFLFLLLLLSSSCMHVPYRYNGNPRARMDKTGPHLTVRIALSSRERCSELP